MSERAKVMLIEEELGMLRTVATYGDGIDFGGPRVSRKVKRLAEDLIARGLLYGSYRNCGLTPAGRAALPREGE